MRRTITAELPGWLGDISFGSSGWWMDIHTLTGKITVPFAPPEGTKGAVLGGEPPNVIVRVSVTMEFVEEEP